MAASRYTTDLSLSLGGDTPTWEGEATVSFLVYWGRPETPPAYSHGGLPADPDEIDDIRVTHIDDAPIAEREHGAFEADQILAHIEGSDRLLSDLLTFAREQAADDYADATERRWEDRRQEQF